MAEPLPRPLPLPVPGQGQEAPGLGAKLSGAAVLLAWAVPRGTGCGVLWADRRGQDSETRRWERRREGGPCWGPTPHCTPLPQEGSASGHPERLTLDPSSGSRHPRLPRALPFTVDPGMEGTRDRAAGRARGLPVRVRPHQLSISIIRGCSLDSWWRSRQTHPSPLPTPVPQPPGPWFSARAVPGSPRSFQNGE